MASWRCGAAKCGLDASYSASGVAPDCRVAPKMITAELNRRIQESLCTMIVPFLKPNPPKLSTLSASLEAIEASGVFSNFGPVNTRFERKLCEQMFGGAGSCMTVCNATIGLMLAIREAIHFSGRLKAKYALVPSFTFAATPHAALWCGLTPILYDVEPGTWLPSRSEEERILSQYGDDIGVIVPYATFGNCLDFSHYEALTKASGIPVVVDAAASLGSLDVDGYGFGRGFSGSIVYSMHVTKTFSTSEGGIIYTSDSDRMQRLRTMANFGFAEPRSATMPGLNAKISEIGALIAEAKLAEIEPIVEQRTELYSIYRQELPDLEFQTLIGPRTAHQFVPVLLPESFAERRPYILDKMKSLGVMAASYFSPHVAEQSYFKETCIVEPLLETEKVSAQIVSLPLHDSLSKAEVDFIAETLRACMV